MIRLYIHLELFFSSRYFPAASLQSPLRQVRWAFVIGVKQIQGAEGSGTCPRSHRLSLEDPSPEACHLPPGPVFFLLPLKVGAAGVCGGVALSPLG